MITKNLYDVVDKRWSKEYSMYNSQKAMLLLIQEWLDHVNPSTDPPVLVIRTGVMRTGKTLLFKFLDDNFDYFVPVTMAKEHQKHHGFSADFGIPDVFSTSFDVSAIKDRIIIFDSVDVMRPEFSSFNINDAATTFIGKGAKGVIIAC
jgi:hypothetical protein